MRRVAAMVMLALAAAGARAQAAAGLPAPDDVMNALRESPRLQVQVESIEQGVQRERKRRAGPHEWLRRSTFVARGIRKPDHVLVDFYVVR